MKLADSELHVWLAFDRELADGSLIEAFTAMLDPGERERAARFRSEEHAHQFLVTRALQRSVLSCYAPDIAPAEWRFVSGERGKPELGPGFTGLGLNFNVSHSARLVVMAVTRAELVGVDVESLGARDAPLDLARRYFTADEARQLSEVPAAEQQLLFYRLWTLKEAWLKAKGTGVAHGLAEISFGFDTAGTLQQVAMPGDEPARWQFWQGQSGRQHLVAVAASNSRSPLRMSVFRRLAAVDFRYEPQPALRLVAGASRAGQSEVP